MLQVSSDKFKTSRSAFVVLFLLALSSLSALAATSGITYHGRILKADGTPLESMNVQFRLQVRTPGSENCLMYEEVRSLNMRNTGGVFELSMNDGTGSRADSTGLTMDRVFANRGSFNFTAVTCDSGTGAWSPNESDGRRFQVYFRDENMSGWEPLPSQALNFVPMAIEAKQIGGFGAKSLLRVEDGTGPQNVTSLTPAQFTELNLLSLGTSTQYMKTGANGAQAPVRSGTPATPVAGQFWFDTATSQLKYYDGATVQTAGGGGGALPALPSGQIWVGNGSNTAVAVTPSGDVTISTTGVYTMKATGTAGTYAKVTTDAQGRVTAGTTLLESDIPTLSTAGKVLGGAITSGTIAGSTAISTSGAITTTGNVTATNVSATTGTVQSLRVFNAGNTFKTTISVPAGLASDFNFVLPSTAGANGYVLTTDGSGNLTWTPAASGSVTSLSGTLPVTIGGSASVPVVGVNAATTAATGVVQLAANGGTTAGTVVQGNDSRLSDARAPSGAASGDLTGNFPAPTVAKLRGVTVSATAPVTSQVLKYGGASWDPAYANFADLKSVIGTAQIPTTCTAAQTWSYSSVSDTFSCINIAVGLAQVTGLGTSASKNIPASGDAATTEVVYGTDTRLTNARAPSGAAGGDLVGTYPNPTLATTGVVAGTYPKVTVDAKGRATAGAALVAADIPGLDWAKITSGKPTTLTGYGITDALVANAGSIVSLQSGLDAAKPAAATDGRLYVATDTQKIYRDNGTAWIVVSSASGTGVSSVTAGTGLTGGTITTTGTIALSTSGATAGTYKSVTVDTYGRVTSATNPTTLSGFGITDPVILDGGNTPAAALSVGTTNAQNLLLKTGGATRATLDTSGNFGVGVASPTVRLDVNGTLKVADGSEACTVAANGGMIRYNTGNLQFCNGTSWQTLGVSGAGLTSLNGQTGSTQTFATPGTAGLAPAWAFTTDTHTLNIPLAATASVTAGLLSNADYAAFSSKLGAASTFTGDVSGTASTTSVDKIKGTPVTITTLTSGNLLRYNGVAWVNTNLVAADVPALDWTKITTGKPTTLAGYGVTDAVGNAGGVPSVSSGLESARPSPATAGRLYVATDTKRTFRDNGTTWDQLDTNASDLVAGTLPVGRLPAFTGGDVTSSAGSATLTLGTVATTKGGTGLTAIGTANQMLGVNNAATGLEYKTITAGSGVSVANSAGAITITATGSGGTVTNVTSANADIGITAGTTIPVLTLNSGVGNNQILKLNGTAQIPAVDGSLLTSLTPANLSAAVPLNKGGTGQVTAIASFNALSPMSAKGDLTTRDASTSVRLAVGADGKYLKADSAQASGLAWSDVTAVDLTSITGTGLVQRTGAGAYSTLGTTAPLGVAAGNLFISQGTGGVVMDGGNTVTGAMSIGSNAAYDLSLRTNSAARMTILSGGNVGIGTSSPQAGLDIATTGTGASAIIVPRDTTTNRPSTAVNGMIRYNTTSAKLEAYQGGSWTNIIGSSTFPLQGSAGTAAAPTYSFSTSTNTGLYLPSVGTLGLAAAGTQVATFTPTDSTFNGYNLTNVTNETTIYPATGTAAGSIAPTGGSRIVAQNNANLDSSVVTFNMNVTNTATNAQNGYIGAVATTGAGSFAPSLVFGQSITGNSYAERMRISASGNVGIGTTSPGAPLDVKGAIRMSGATSGFTGFQPAAAAGGTVWTLPVADGGANSVLTTNGSGILSWSTPSGTGVATLTVNAPITNGGTASAPNLSIAPATGSTNGYLTSADWTTFNGKQSTTLTNGSIYVGNGSNVATGVALSGDATITNAGVLTVGKIQNRTVASTTPVTSQVLRYNTATTTWETQYLNVSDLKKSDGTTQFQSASCAAGQTLTWSLITDLFTCTTISITKSQVSDLGTIGTAASQNFGTAAGNLVQLDGGAKIPSSLLPAGTVSQWTTSGSNIYYNTGNVAIGTATSSALTKLHVKPDATQYMGLILDKLDATTGGGLWLNDNTKSWIVDVNSGKLRFNIMNPNLGTFASTPMTIDNSGNVGIGTTAPSTLLSVGGTYGPGNTDVMQLGQSFTGANTNLAIKWGPTNSRIQNYYTSYTGGFYSGLQFVTDNNGVATTAMTLVGAGNVGVGTANPATDEKMSVNGGMYVDFGALNSGTIANGLRFGGSGAAQGIASKATAGGNQYGLDFYTGYNSRLSISSSGNVGIGTTSPQTTLDVNGGAAVNSSYEGISAYVNTTTAYTIPDTSVNIRRLTLTGNATVTLPAFTTPTTKIYSVTIFLKQDATGARTVAFAGNGSDTVKWDSNVAPTIASAAGKITIIQLMKPSDETVWYGSMTWKEN